MVIYKGYDKAALDLQFNNRSRVPDYERYFADGETRSRQTERGYKVIKDIAYGNHQRERLDIYPSSLPASKTLIFIHGGYWYTLDKTPFHFIAGAFLPHHITTVFITYPQAPEASMDQVVHSCRAALRWIYANIAGYNGDPDQLYVAGHSAGGHLAAMLMAADWCHFNVRLPETILKGVCTMSGLFNLLPVQLSGLNDTLKMDDEVTMRNSPVELCPVIRCPLLITVGAEESEEFKDQSEELYNCWKTEGVEVQLLSLPGINHYSIVNALAEKNSALHQGMLELMGVSLGK